MEETPRKPRPRRRSKSRSRGKSVKRVKKRSVSSTPGRRRNDDVSLVRPLAQRPAIASPSSSFKQSPVVSPRGAYGLIPLRPPFVSSPVGVSSQGDADKMTLNNLQPQLGVDMSTEPLENPPRMARRYTRRKSLGDGRLLKRPLPKEPPVSSIGQRSPEHFNVQAATEHRSTFRHVESLSGDEEGEVYVPPPLLTLSHASPLPPVWRSDMILLEDPKAEQLKQPPFDEAFPPLPLPKWRAHHGNTPLSVVEGALHRAIRPSSDRRACLRCIKKVAKAGAGCGLFALSQCYDAGFLVGHEDKATSFALLKEAARKRSNEALHCIGCFLWEGFAGVPKDDEGAAYVWSLAAERGHSAAANNLAFCYWHGVGGCSQDRELAFYLWLYASPNGCPEAQFNLALSLLLGVHGSPLDVTDTLDLFFDAAAQGLPEAMYNLGVYYQHGIGGVEPDFEAARACYTEAVRLGDVESMYNLGVMYELGIGVDADTRKSKELWLEAARRGSDRASIALLEAEHYRMQECFALKNEYTCSFNLEKVARVPLPRFSTPEKALHNFANATGCADAYNVLGKLQEEVDEIRPSFFKAACSYFLKASSFGSVEAMYRLGKLLLWSKSGNDHEAEYYLSEAARKGHENALVVLSDRVLRHNPRNLARVAATLVFMGASLNYHPGALGRLGYFYRYGKHGVSADVIRARYLWEQGVQRGNPESMYSLGLCFATGSGGLKKTEKSATRLWVRAARKGNVRALYNLGVCYMEGVGGVPQSDHLAVEAWKLAAQKGSEDANYNLGVLHEKGRAGLAADLVLAVKHYKAAADKGLADAQYNLASCYRRGIGGLAVDIDRAVHYCKKAARQGLPDALYSLAVCYISGIENFPQNPGRAITLYTAAARRNHAPSQYELAILYEEGLGGLPKDEKKAASLLQRAARGQVPSALYELAMFYEAGSGGLPQDEVKARKCLEAAIRLGHVGAMYELGVYYEFGKGGLQLNEDVAMLWYHKAAELGNQLAREVVGGTRPPLAKENHDLVV